MYTFLREDREMTERAEFQSQYCSKLDIKRICSFDYEVIEDKTNPLYHQSPRFLFIKKGKAKFKVDTELYEVEEGCLLSILPWDCTEVVEVEDPLQYEIVKYNYDVMAGMIQAIVPEDEDEMPILKKLEITPVITLRQDQIEGIASIFGLIKDEVGVESLLTDIEPQSYHEMMVCTLISRLIISFCRMIDDQRMIPEVLAEPGDKRALILRYISMHLGDRMTLDKLAKQFYMSKSSISKYIFEKTGLTFSELLNEMRVTKTVNYLLYTDFTLEELASIVGYVDAAHISKVFESRMDDKIGHFRKTYGKAMHIGQVEESKKEYHVIEYISRNYAEDISIQSVSNEFDISFNEINRMLLGQVQKNFYEFLNTIRINKASELLIESDMDITDIAISVGYNTVKAFRRHFVQQRRMKPSEFRRQYQIQE